MYPRNPNRTLLLVQQSMMLVYAHIIVGYEMGTSIKYLVIHTWELVQMSHVRVLDINLHAVCKGILLR